MSILRDGKNALKHQIMVVVVKSKLREQIHVIHWMSSHELILRSQNIN